MGCYQDALSNIMPVDWLDPYGRTPFANGAEMPVDITIVETQDGIKASSVKNPPTTGSNRLINAIKQALGVDLMNCGAENGLQRSDDLGKQDDMINKDKKKESQDSDTMKSSSSGGSGDRDRNPGSQGSRPDGSRPLQPGTSKDDEDAKEKAPKF